MGRRPEGWHLRRPRPPKQPCYAVRFYLNGSERTFTTGCRDQREAQKAAARIYAEKTGGSPQRRLPTGKGDLETLTALWIASDKVQGKSQGWRDTLELYVSTHWLPRWSDLSEVTSQAIEQYIGERLRAKWHGRKVSATTIRKELSGLRKFLEWCKAAGHVVHIPAWDSPEGKTDYQAVCLTEQQILDILAALPTHQTHIRHSPIREFYIVMWATGFRRSTMWRIQWADIDWERQRLRLRASADKKRFGREIPLTSEAMAALASLPRGVGLVFGKHDYRLTLKAAAARVGIRPDDAVRLANHSVRHSRATAWLADGAPITGVQYMLGHKHLESTAKYHHPEFEHAEKLIRGLSGEHSGEQSGSSENTDQLTTGARRGI